MRIGIDCRMYSPSFTGIGRYAFELVQGLARIDRLNQYFLFFNSFSHPELVSGSTSSLGPNFIPVAVNAPHYSLKEQTGFLKILNRHKLDLMHFTHFNAPIFYNRPSIVTIHDLTLHFFPGKKMNSPFHRAAYNLTIKSVVNKARRVIAVSHNTAADLESILHLKASKIKVIYEGVNDNFQPITNVNELTPTLTKFQIKKNFLLYSGVWRDHKNLKGLIKAFSQLEKKFELQLVITGKPDPIYSPEIFKLVEELHLQSSVVFTGHVSEAELIHLLNAASVYVFPSFYEGFGLPPLESMACGTPVAVSNTSCLPEICGDSAVYFDPYRPEKIAEAVEKLLTDQKLYQKMVASGFEHVKKYSWDKMVQETHQLYLDSL